MNIEIRVNILQNGHLTTRLYNQKIGSRGVTDEEQYANEINAQL
jgi:hypothetical protein